MKVINRSQVTEVISRRNVYHVLELDGIRYSRIESITTRLPYMDCDPLEPTIKVIWKKYVGKRVVENLSKKDAIKLGLIEAFNNLDINDRNGNGYAK